MQISKSIAEMIAITLVAKKDKEASNLTDEYHKYVYDTYMEQTPDEIKKVFKKHPEWFHIRNNIVVDSSNHNWKEIATAKPVIGNTSTGRAHLQATAAIKKRIDDYVERINKIKQDAKALRLEIETALLQLRTTKRIAEAFPEATKYLPKANLLPMVNIDPIREKLKRIA